MLWVRSDLDAEQLPVNSSYLTAVTLRLPHGQVLMLLCYVEGGGSNILEEAVARIMDSIYRVPFHIAEVF